jgi:hypothetical protein
MGILPLVAGFGDGVWRQRHVTARAQKLGQADTGGTHIDIGKLSFLVCASWVLVVNLVLQQQILPRRNRSVQQADPTDFLTAQPFGWKGVGYDVRARRKSSPCIDLWSTHSPASTQYIRNKTNPAPCRIFHIYVSQIFRSMSVELTSLGPILFCFL